MSKDNFIPYIDNNSWLDCIGQLQDSHIYSVEDFPLSKQPLKPEFPIVPQTEKQPLSLQKNSNQDLIDLISLQENIGKNTFKRPQPTTLLDDDFFTSNSSSNDVKNCEVDELLQIQNDQESPEGKTGSRKEKSAKQYIYSKNYRDKKKQEFKALKEENYFLKNKIEELQLRLRQQETQITRLKYQTNEKQLSIQQLNKQFMEKIQIMADSVENTISKSNSQQQNAKNVKKAFEKQFLKGYQEHGFNGSKKKGILQYHINEMLEGVLRDSEKYLCMLCWINRDDSFKVQIPEYKKINTAFFQIMDLNQKDMPRLDLYIKILFPAMKQIKRECANMYKSYNKMIQSLDRVHYGLQSTYLQNIDFIIKRMKLESWFEYHKYHKIMRKLKSDWIQFIKNEKIVDQNFQKHKRGYKKKKGQERIMEQ